MGLFDIFSTKTPIEEAYMPYSESEALFALLHICTKADGSRGDAENLNMVNMLQVKKIFRHLGSVENIYMDVHAAIEQLGETAVIEGSIKKLPESMLKTAFVLCADIVLSDGVVTQEEGKILSAIGERLNIQEGFAKMVFEVMTVKNFGNI